MQQPNSLTVVAAILAAVAGSSKVLALLGPRFAPSASRRVSAPTPAASGSATTVNEFGGAEMASLVENEAMHEKVLDPGRFTKVSVETQAGELEARLSEYGNWEVRVRRHDEPTWKHACRGDLNSGSQTMLPVAPKTVETMIRGPIVVDAAGRRVTVEEREVSLAKKEFALLIALAQDPERVWTKAQLLKSVWGHESDTKTRTLDSHASRLRLKFQRAGVHGIVVNVWGVGYKFWDRLDPDWAPPESMISEVV